MPDSQPPPSSQIPPPASNNAVYVVAVVLLLAAIGGIVFWKLGGASREAAPLPKTTPLATLTQTPIFDPPPPPPPPPEEVQQVEAGVARSAPGGSSQCASAKCAGSASPELRRALSLRAAASRGCYERALRVNSGLQGQITVGVRVDSAGSVCSASVVQDQIHSNEVSTCLLGMFRSSKFPAASGGCVDVNVPMSFVPQESK